MSKKDGKSTLIGAEENRGFHTVKVGDEEFDANMRAALNCPVKIIDVKKI